MRKITISMARPPNIFCNNARFGGPVFFIDNFCPSSGNTYRSRDGWVIHLITTGLQKHGFFGATYWISTMLNMTQFRCRIILSIPSLTWVKPAYSKSAPERFKSIKYGSSESAFETIGSSAGQSTLTVGSSQRIPDSEVGLYGESMV